MKKKTTGGQYTKRESIEFPSNKELIKHLEKEGSPQTDGSIKFGASFQDRVEALKDFATEVLISKGLPAAPILYQVNERTYIDSTDEEDIDRANDTARRLRILQRRIGVSPTSVTSKITKGKKLSPDFKEKWVSEKPEPRYCYGIKFITNFVEERNFKRDGPEDLAARIIIEIHHLTHATIEARRLMHAMTLGELFLTAKVYGLQSFQGRKNARDKARNPWARKLADALRNKTQVFKEAWKLIPVSSVNGPYFSDDIKAYIDNTGEEEVLCHAADDGTNSELEKESFRTGYFVKKK